MKTITKIDVQKRNPKRRSVYVDGEFVAGVGEELVAELGLLEGAPIDEGALHRVLLAEEERRVRESAYRYLARRAHSEFELRTKLRRRGFREAMIDSTLDALRQRGYVDDVEFARTFVRSQMATKPQGSTALRASLRKKGVASQIVDRVVPEEYPEVEPLSIAREVALKRLPRYKGLEPLKTKQRLANLLQRRGFASDVIWEVLREVIPEVERPET